ncbi:antitoxin Xre/MbcA/ParS toxin-binding domain-containing protein [Pseudomonas sp. MDT1-16]
MCALVGVLNATLELFEGDLSAAREWRKSPARGLNSRLPLDMTSTWVEAQAVIDLIGQLEHGYTSEWRLDRLDISKVIIPLW